ncbi:hypothetical protein ACIRRI_48280, partial [Streptomyces mirabilis]|uniref:hypothetical protein n=1 Tax=Streptomyces mirabilis TaxID=68239 RepID=UPI003822A328
PQFRHLFRGEIHTRLNDQRSLRFHEQDHETLVRIAPAFQGHLNSRIRHAHPRDCNGQTLANVRRIPKPLAVGL